MNIHSTMTLPHVWPHPFSSLHKSLGVHAAFFEEAFEAFWVAVLISIVIAVVTGWGVNMLFFEEIPSAVYNSGMDGSLFSGVTPNNFEFYR
jgi:hypothetical protein